MDLRLLEKFFDNRCSPDEVAEVLRWFDTADHQAQTLADLEAYWRTFRPDDVLPATPTARRLRLLHERIAQRDTSAPFARSRIVSPTRRWLPYLRVAAVVLLAVIGAWTWYQHVSSAGSPLATTVVKTNPPGQKTSFRLPDGTRVVLNAASELRYSSGFGAQQRDVQLTGEAFFEVVSDPERPFTVTARGVATTALGTSFNVRAYEPTVDVALVSGKVRVRKTDQSRAWILAPGEHLTYPPRALPRQGRYDPRQMLAWQEGTLYFSQATLPEVVRQLERWYGVTIDLRHAEGQAWRYTGQFSQESLENVLIGLSYTQDFTYDINNQQVTLTFNQLNQRP